MTDQFSQIVAIAERVDVLSPLAYRGEAGMGLLLDDRIWLWLIAAERFNAERCSGDTERPGEIVLSSMIHAGLHDWSNSERPSEASTRLMRYTVCLADHLWEGIESEGNKVLFPAPPACREANSEDSEKLLKLGSLHKSNFAWQCTKTIFAGLRRRCSGGRRASTTIASRKIGSTCSYSCSTSALRGDSMLRGD